ncbi:MAG: class I SAM-dependent methyltransferase [Syntrophomonadaceae bacterium]|nr:class I SAM-dependent methyltransferase [Syntrophomonadaceae bacterium]MDD3023124.1 class I SAM-dependent methyltransferase [Syntrophomonadaceae bacterium]
MSSKDLQSYVNSLLLSQYLRKPIIKSIIQSMQLPTSSTGLDLGCGIGLNTILLAEVLGPCGQVIGLDREEEMLLKARSLLSKSEVNERISLEKGDVGNLPFPDKSFDWACSIDCVGAIAVDPVPLLKEVIRVVKPGGQVFIIIWSSQSILPGFPLLEARLNASSAGIAPFAIGMAPEMHTMRALGWFKQAGFTDNRAQTFIRDICPPLKAEIIAAMTDLFNMRWGSIEKEVAPELWHDYQRLCRPDSPDFILKIPDYYAFFTYSVFSGRVQ